MLTWPFLYAVCLAVVIFNFEGSHPLVSSGFEPLWLLIAWAIFLPVTVTAGYRIVAAYAGNSKVPIVRRRRDYLKLALYWVGAVLASHFALTWYLIQSGKLGELGINWLSDPDLGNTAFLPFFSLALLIPLVRYAKRVEARLYGPEDSSILKPPKVSPEEKSYRLKATFIGIGILAFIVFGLAAFVIGFQSASYTEWIGLAMLFLGVLLLRALRTKIPSLLRGGTSYGIGQQDALLSQRADMLAQIMGTKSKPVRIQDGASASVYFRAHALPAAILVTKSAAETLDPAEMNFILAHELAHYKQNYLRHMQIAISLSVWIIAALVFYPLLASQPYPREYVFPGFGAIALLYLMFLRCLRTWARRMEFDADRRAVEATGDPDAAISALTKFTQHHVYPRLHDQDFRYHPAMPKRLEALREIKMQSNIKLFQE